MNKHIIVLACTGLIIGMLAGCTTREAPTESVSQPSSMEKPTQSSVSESSLVSDSDKADMRDYVLRFADLVQSPYANSSDIPEDLISELSFREIYFDTSPPVETDGSCTISKAALTEFVSTRFGVANYVHKSELPEYIAETDSYKFFFLGEGSMYELECTSEVYDNDIAIFVVNYTPKGAGADGPTGEDKSPITFNFKVVSSGGSSYLLFLSSEQ